MADLGTIICPHCGVVNDAPAQFCSACGMALPSQMETGPRIIKGKTVATTAAGQKLQSEELLNTARQAARSLLSIGVINLVYAGLFIFLIYQRTNGQWQRASLYSEANAGAMLISGVIYMAMYYWAKFSPLAATVVGLAVYMARWGVDIIIHETLAPPHVTNAYSYGFMRIIMVLYLIRGVAAGWQHRKLEQQQRDATLPIAALPID